MKKHSNIAIFIPHEGCPNNCSFCNQHEISGTRYAPKYRDVISACETAIKTNKTDPNQSEIAFFGGSFTAIDKNYMVELLSTASNYVAKGHFKGIRISTRPDCINAEILQILKQFKVTAIELGAQSMNDEVLKANNRGHTANDVRCATQQIKAMGFELGLQMMTGLYKSNKQIDLYSAKTIAALEPKTVRIYPTITLKQTVLESLYIKNKYKPPSLGETVDLCAHLLKFFDSRGIDVIRVGLHADKNLEKNIVAGPWHPAFNELCQSKIMLDRTQKIIKNVQNDSVVLYVNPKDISRMIGQKRKNILQLEHEGYKVKVKSDPSVKLGQISYRK